MLTRTDMQAQLVLLVSAVAQTVSEARAIADSSPECGYGLGSDASSCSAMSGYVTKLAEYGMDLIDRVRALEGYDITVADFEFLTDRGQLLIESARSFGKLRNTDTLQRVFNDTMTNLAEHVGEAFYVVGHAAGGATKGLLFGLGPVGLLLVAALVFVYAKGKAA